MPTSPATKIKHLLDTTDGLRARAARGEMLFGTVDSFLIWRLTGGRVHVTDVSNASRTLLYNIHTRDGTTSCWRCSTCRGRCCRRCARAARSTARPTPELFGGAIPIAGAAGDQQAALFGQACFEPGTAKNTYGTGCFMLLNTGEPPVPSTKGLLTTVAWRLGGAHDLRPRRARCSSPAPRCSGCATGCGRSRRRPTSSG